MASIISELATSEISIHVAEQAGLSLTWTQATKASFLTTQAKFCFKFEEGSFLQTLKQRACTTEILVQHPTFSLISYSFGINLLNQSSIEIRIKYTDSEMPCYRSLDLTINSEHLH